MKIKQTPGDIVFNVINYAILTFLALICVIPFIHLIALSFSSSAMAAAGRVGLWPQDFTLASYQYAFQTPTFLRAFGITILRVVLGVSLNMVLLVLTAYPLSKRNKEMPGRTIISWFFVIPMFIGGGLIPTYLVDNATGINNTIFALIIPGAVSVYNVMILLNFFRQTPKELEESALMDGASQFTCLVKIYVPLAIPCLGTLFIFCTVGHWNDWFSGMIYINSSKNYPLMTYLQNLIQTPDFSLADPSQAELLSKINSKTYQAAQIVIATVPILVVYPFMQKYFVTGMTLGAMKG